MSDRNASKKSNHKRRGQKNKDKEDQEYHREGIRRTCLKVFQYEIDDLKDQLRATYSAEVKKSMNLPITTDEEKLVDEKAINMALIKRLQEMTNRFKRTDDTMLRITHDHSFTLLNFFYLVRLAQQGFFQLVASEYPSMEVQAVTYLCDQLVGLSLQSSRAKNMADELDYARKLTALTNKIYFGDREPIAEGFKTTFKDINKAILGLADKSFQQDNNAEQTEEQRLSHAKLTQPPVWIVMPYTSMIDGGYSNISGLINSLSAQLPQPFPQSSLIPPQSISIGKNEPENHHDSTQELEKETNEVHVKGMGQEEESVEKKNEENEETVNEEKKKDALKEEIEVQEETVKEEALLNGESTEQPQEVKADEPLAQETQVVDETVEESDVASQNDLDDDRFADPDMDKINEMPIQPSPLDSFMNSASGEWSIPKEKVPDSSASSTKWNGSLSNTIPDSPQSTDSKPKMEDMASADWKNFRAPDQTNRKKSSSAKKNQHRQSQR